MARLRILPFWLIAALVTTFFMSLVHSLMVQQGLIDLGIAIPAGLRLETMARDFIGLLPALGAVTALGFAIAFLIAGGLYRFAPALAYPLAGAVAIAVALMLMKLQFDMTPIAGARSPLGLGLMIAAGALGGLVFGRLKKR
ncbi:hypothetical protein GCM10007973_27600 [Polymorphobacter multimanifer]|uniref:Uncharacterized protein n=1 Tax=Polymorphobacter multimanifer TaxID=1070431 RepID=A0A841LCQ6_9SPHN|nr:hypothetical protein [Polymorphobacter multimanifer]MBB6227595.1 hypothetical protein [Polymorphobacter multimanifer]GGI89724.1 hypothetical protein GCM10007973_27600 [Polymorphobacter multimanifer]